MGDGMADFMAENRRQSGIGLGDGQDPRIHANFSPGQTEGVGFLTFKDDELPLCVGHVLSGDLRDALPDALHLCVQVWIVTDRRVLFELIEARKAELHFLVG